MLSIAKPSISMGHLYHGYVSHDHWISPYFTNKPSDLRSLVSALSNWRTGALGLNFHSEGWMEHMKNMV